MEIDPFFMGFYWYTCYQIEILILLISISKNLLSIQNSTYNVYQNMRFYVESTPYLADCTFSSLFSSCFSILSPLLFLLFLVSYMNITITFFFIFNILTICQNMRWIHFFLKKKKFDNPLSPVIDSIIFLFFWQFTVAWRMLLKSHTCVIIFTILYYTNIYHQMSCGKKYIQCNIL